MSLYFKKEHSIFSMNGGDIQSTIKTMANRYIAANPEFPLIYRAYCMNGIQRDKEFRYFADFNKFFPNSKNRQIVYAWTNYYSQGDGSLRLDLNCISPTILYVNGEIQFKSTIFQERYPERRVEIEFPVVTGDNTIVLEISKSPAGFGMLMGTWLGKFNLYFNSPSKEREGQEGFIFTAPLDKPLEKLPVTGMYELDTGVEWLPFLNWESKFNLSRMFPENDGKVVCYTKLDCVYKGEYMLVVDTNTSYQIYIDNKLSENKVKIDFGIHDLVVVADKKGDDCFLNLKCGDLEFLSPCNIWGCDEKWIYCGIFSDDIDLSEIVQLNYPINSKNGLTYWRLDLNGMVVRPYNENDLFGEWNYPLGVTLYGLLSSARELGLTYISEYIKSHINLCCETFSYAIWDREKYGGGTSIHNLLASIDSLDDCGSFGSAMLETAKFHHIKNVRKVADYVADYISNKQIRLGNGVFFRKNLMHVFHEDTMWADDLYMSIPFLLRYYELTKDTKYIDDCAKQILGFKEYLYMPELKIMSHVFDFKVGCMTGVAWGRGNGWTAFTISEFMEYVPGNHEKRSEILEFFKEFCEGLLKLQDHDGMWHQVLTDHESYAESSCSAMFIYAFSKGIMNGWLNGKEYIDSILKGFRALTKYSIDKNGNLYGVCRGSEFSFNADYYKYELLPRLNDPHGIGITLLAATEVLKLKRWLKENREVFI